MSIPDLNEHGLLPVGVHVCTMEELRQRFGRFTTSDHRVHLFEKLEELIQNAKATGLVREIYVDGSFVTDKEKPNDIDLILVFDERVPIDPSSEMLPADYNALSTKRLRRRYNFDVKVVYEDTDAFKRFMELFQTVKNSELRKGILRIEL